MMLADILILIADSAASPPHRDVDEYSHLELPAIGGWRVVFFYDCGDLDYIEHFVSPTGQLIDFWKWPDCIARDRLIAWCGCEAMTG